MSNIAKKAFLGLKALYNLNVNHDPGSFVPPIMVVMLSDRCNYRCVTCSCYEIGDKNKELSTEQWQKVLKDFVAMGGISVRFTGGEVFLRKKTLYPLIEFLNKNNVAVKISTNGSLIRKDDIEFLKKNRVDVVEISLHGREKTHEEYVKIGGSHKRTLDLIDRLKSAGIPVRLAFTIIKSNLNEIEYIVQLAHEKNITVSFNILESNAYYFQGMDKAQIPSQDDMGTASQTLIDLKTKYPKTVNGEKSHFMAIPSLYVDSRLPEYYCARVLMHVYMDSFGSVYHGCWAMPSAGNVKEAGLGDIMKSKAYVEGRKKGFDKECPGCTCGYQMDIGMNFKKRRR